MTQSKLNYKNFLLTEPTNPTKILHNVRFYRVRESWGFSSSSISTHNHQFLEKKHLLRLFD